MNLAGSLHPSSFILLPYECLTRMKLFRILFFGVLGLYVCTFCGGTLAINLIVPVTVFSDVWGAGHLFGYGNFIDYTDAGLFTGGPVTWSDYAGPTSFICGAPIEQGYVTSGFDDVRVTTDGHRCGMAASTTARTSESCPWERRWVGRWPTPVGLTSGTVCSWSSRTTACNSTWRTSQRSTQRLGISSPPATQWASAGTWDEPWQEWRE